MKCEHDLAEKETACADGMCPVCLAAEVERLKNRMRIVVEECLAAETVNGIGWWTKARELLEEALKEKQ